MLPSEGLNAKYPVAKSPYKYRIHTAAKANVKRSPRHNYRR